MPRAIGNFLEVLSQAILVGIMLVGRLGVYPARDDEGTAFRIAALTPICSCFLFWCVYIYIYIYTLIYLYIYIYRERERYTHIMCLLVCIGLLLFYLMYFYVFCKITGREIPRARRSGSPRSAPRSGRRRGPSGSTPFWATVIVIVTVTKYE